MQEETGGFTAFIPWSFQPANTALGGRRWDEATAVDYLKVLAISRLYLSNFLNVQSSWVTQGLKVCQMGLRFGGNDVGSVMLEENVVRAAGVNNCTTEEELRRIIRDAALPAQRIYPVSNVFPELKSRAAKIPRVETRLARPASEGDARRPLLVPFTLIRAETPPRSRLLRATGL